VAANIIDGDGGRISQIQNFFEPVHTTGTAKCCPGTTIRDNAVQNRIRHATARVDKSFAPGMTLKHELCDGFSMVHFGAQAGENLAFYSSSWITGDSARQQTPYRCHNRNHGLCTSKSSCRRFAAERSLGLSGLISGASNISSSCSMSSIVRSMSIRHNIQHGRGNRQTERHLRPYRIPLLDKRFAQ